jgi:uncharacterized protein (DUF305 family)
MAEVEVEPEAGSEDEGGPEDELDAVPTSSGGGSRVLQLGALALAVALALVTAGVIGYSVAGPKSPGDGSVAAGFARDMTDHHAQAVDMATIIGQRTTSLDIRTLATDIALTQTNQMGQMQGWLSQWNLSLGRTGPPMAWMTIRGGMDMGQSGQSGGNTAPAMDPALMQPLPDGRMPGMATDAQINQLRTLPVKPAEVLFLQLMIAHHRAGLVMAQMARSLTTVAVVDRLTTSMISGQQNEITQMTQMLAARGATP